MSLGARGHSWLNIRRQKYDDIVGSDYYALDYKMEKVEHTGLEFFNFRYQGDGDYSKDNTNTTQNNAYWCHVNVVV